MGLRFSKVAANAACTTTTTSTNKQQTASTAILMTTFPPLIAITQDTLLLNQHQYQQQHQQAYQLLATAYVASNISTISSTNSNNRLATIPTAFNFSISDNTTAVASIIEPQKVIYNDITCCPNYNNNNNNNNSNNNISNNSSKIDSICLEKSIIEPSTQSIGLNTVSGSFTELNTFSGSRQIIIKIQLTKMENGNHSNQALLQVQPSLLNENPLTATSNHTISSKEHTISSSIVGKNNISLPTLSLTMTGNEDLINKTSMTKQNISSSNPIEEQSSNLVFYSDTVPLSISSSSYTFSLPIGKNTVNDSNPVNPVIRNSSSNIEFCSSDLSIMSNSKRDNDSSSIDMKEPNKAIIISNHDCNVSKWNIYETNVGNAGVLFSSSIEQEKQGQPKKTASDLNTCETSCTNCRRGKLKTMTSNNNIGNDSVASSTTRSVTDATVIKRRCCKYSCRSAFRRILDSTSSTTLSLRNKSIKEKDQQTQHSNAHSKKQPMDCNCGVNSNNNNISISNLISPTSMKCLNTQTAFTIIQNSPTIISTPGENVSLSSQQLEIWTVPNSQNSSNNANFNVGVIPISPPQFVVVQCAILNSDEMAKTSIASSSLSIDSENITAASRVTNRSCTLNTTSEMSSTTTMLPLETKHNRSVLNTGPVVHSQVDFSHYLVPDLERIANSSFYWGKMDQYEAERLLDGKPEGTFLLRDSVQEEFLFSVTFRKYGLSLHARIQQRGHRFSFACHDPCVFTAPTVTGLLEHYKGTACRMFFEPILTIPLHRRTCLSLQQLCRATIVSHTTYDGINNFKLPPRLKAYLKEYHYKHKLRVKPFDETFYTNFT